MSQLMINKSEDGRYQITRAFTDSDGSAWTPDTSIKMTVYDENADTKIINAEDMAVKDSHAGIYTRAFNISSNAVGSYSILYVAVNNGDTYKEQDKLIISTGGLTGFDKRYNSTIEITAVFPGTDGVAVAPDTSIKISIYPADSDTEIITEQNMSVKDSETGYYKYAWDISGVDEGVYNVVITAVDNTITYILTETYNISDTTLATSDGTVKFFDTNLVEGATLSEPDLSVYGRTTDIIENIRDNRVETKIVLTPLFLDADLVDKDLEDVANWAETDCTLANDSSIKVVGSESFKMDDLSNGDTANFTRTFGAFDLTDHQIGWIAVYFDDTAPDSVKLEIKDSATADVSVTKTTDYLGNAFTVDTWQYIAFDLSGDGTIDYTDIEDVTIFVANTTGGELDNMYFDGLRFTPHFLNFRYQFSSAQDVRLMELKGTTTKEYRFEYSTDASSWTLIQEDETLTDSYAIWFNDTAESDIYFRVQVHIVNQDGGFGIDIGDILILDYLGRGAFDDDGNINPVLNNAIEQVDNWVFAKHVFKTSKFFTCNMEFNGFPSTQEAGVSQGQDDSDYAKVLFNRTIPFYMWLNGDRGNTGWGILKEVWKEQNLYLVQDISTSLEGHQSHEDHTNGGEAYTLEVVESAWIEAK